MVTIQDDSPLNRKGAVTSMMRKEIGDDKRSSLDGDSHSGSLLNNSMKSLNKKFPNLSSIKSNDLQKLIADHEFEPHKLKRGNRLTNHLSMIQEKDKFLRHNQDYRKFLRQSVKLYRKESLNRIQSTNLKVPNIINKKN